jgi:hypothetical protein
MGIYKEKKMKIYVVNSTSDCGEEVFDFYKTKSKANKRLKELNDQYAYIKEYNFSANRTGLITAMIRGLNLTYGDAIGEVEK